MSDFKVLVERCQKLAHFLKIRKDHFDWVYPGKDEGSLIILDDAVQLFGWNEHPHNGNPFVEESTTCLGVDAIAILTQLEDHLIKLAVPRMRKVMAEKVEEELNSEALLRVKNLLV